MSLVLKFLNLRQFMMLVLKVPNLWPFLMVLKWLNVWQNLMLVLKMVWDQRSSPATMATPMAPNFCARAYYKGERQQPYLLKGRGRPSLLRTCETPGFLFGQTLTHSGARVSSTLHTLMVAPAFEGHMSRSATPNNYTCY